MLARLELDAYETELVLGLIGNHLEMSAALRRDIFDAETVRAFAAKVQTPEALRMLTLFTYADINAVHPDALTPWKAENLWRLYIATANYLDRSVDEERVSARRESELVHRVVASAAGTGERRWRRFWRDSRSGTCGRGRRSRCGRTSRWRRGLRRIRCSWTFAMRRR